MSTVTVTYSHAAPYIRRRLIDEVAKTVSARTQRDRLAAWSGVHAYSQSLAILADSQDQDQVEGIADVDSAPVDALRETLRFLGVVDRKTGAIVDPTASSALEILSAEGVAAMIAAVQHFDDIQAHAGNARAATQDALGSSRP